MADLPELPDEGVIEVGGFTVPCEICGLLVPMTVNAFVGIDDEDDACIFTEIVSLDLEMHLLTHEGIEFEVIPEDG